MYPITILLYQFRNCNEKMIHMPPVQNSKKMNITPHFEMLIDNFLGQDLKSGILYCVQCAFIFKNVQMYTYLFVVNFVFVYL